MEDPRIKQARDLMIAVTNDERKKRFADKQDATDNHICNCGHRRIEHTKSYSLNYTEGFCTIGECSCRHFNYNRASVDEPIPRMKKCKEEMCGVLMNEDAPNYCHHHNHLNKKQ